jgi:hypothetical protein
MHFACWGLHGLHGLNNLFKIKEYYNLEAKLKIQVPKQTHPKLSDFTA